MQLQMSKKTTIPYPGAFPATDSAETFTLDDKTCWAAKRLRRHKDGRQGVIFTIARFCVQ